MNAPQQVSNQGDIEQQMQATLEIQLHRVLALRDALQIEAPPGVVAGLEKRGQDCYHNTVN